MKPKKTTYLIPENLIKSAEISADAYGIPFFVTITKESEFWGIGGQYSTARKGSEYRNSYGQLTEPLLAVLP